MAEPKREAKVLVIEDLRTFRFPATYARTLAEAWLPLFSDWWDEVWLDYDLGLTTESETTYPLVRQMEQYATEGRFLPIGRVVVHTANPNGGDRIMAALSPWYDTVRVQASDYLSPFSDHNEWIGPR